MRIFLLFLYVGLTACGVTDQGITDAADSLAESNSGGVVAQPSDPKEVVIEYRKDGDKVSLVVEDTKDLPACSNANAGQSAHVKRINSFFQCSGAAWIEQAEEPIGSSGSSVEKTKSIVNPDLAYVSWTDPVSKKIWNVFLTPGPEFNKKLNEGSFVCSEEPEDLQALLARGLGGFIQAQNHPEGWAFEALVSGRVNSYEGASKVTRVLVLPDGSLFESEQGVARTGFLTSIASGYVFACQATPQ